MRNRPTWNLCDSPSQSAASLCSCTAVHWLISQSLPCCPYWLLLLSIRFSSEPSPRLCLCEFLSGRAAEAPLRIGQREKPVVLSYWSVCRWTILIGWTEQSLSSGRALPGWELRPRSDGGSVGDGPGRDHGGGGRGGRGGAAGGRRGCGLQGSVGGGMARARSRNSSEEAWGALRSPQQQVSQQL